MPEPGQPNRACRTNLPFLRKDATTIVKTPARDEQGAAAITAMTSLGRTLSGTIGNINQKMAPDASCA